MKHVCLLFCILFSGWLSGQQIFSYEKEIPIRENGMDLRNPWSGGLNAAQFSAIDLDQDGVLDMIAFDRYSNEIIPFIYSNGQYIWAPEYSSLFPEGLKNWVLLRDFDCDGKMDLFSNSTFGIQQFRNIADNNGLAFELVANPILTEGLSGKINLQVNPLDIPAIEDVDEDGDLDILAFNFAGSGGIEFHQNFAVEEGLACGTMQLKKIASFWGDFKECSCGSFAFKGADCPPSGGKIAHVVGKSLTVIDYDKDGIKDVLYSEEDCNELYLLRNEGDNLNASFMDGVFQFPDAAEPITGLQFPTAYSIDIDHDGKNDLVVAPAIGINLSNTYAHENSIRYLKHQPDGSYALIEDAFLQNTMLDIGSDAIVQFKDIDFDGDQDMILTGQNQRSGLGTAQRLRLYQNVGNKNNPEFELENEDLFSLSLMGSSNYQLYIADLDQDGIDDWIIKNNDSGGNATLQYWSGTEKPDYATKAPTVIDNTLSSLDQLAFYDINQDGKCDMLVGKTNGSLAYYKGGFAAAPFFTLENAAFYGIEVSFTKRNLSPLVYDINNDNLVDLITSNSFGEVFVYPSFLQHLNSPKQGEILTYTSGNENFTTPSFGFRSHLAGVNLKNKTPQLAIASLRGGVQLMDNTLATTNGGKETLFTVYPNPASRTVQEYISLTPLENLVITLYDMQGKKISTSKTLTANIEYQLSIVQLSAGTYIVSGTKEDGSTDQSKIVIYK